MTNLLLAMLFFAVSGFGVMRTLDSDHSPAPVKETFQEEESQTGSANGRVFVLLIESLRARTALSSDLMPYLAGLGARAYRAEIRPVDEALSPGSLIVAFTGRDEIQGLGTMRKFVEPPRPRPSIFTQLKDAGLSSAVYSDQWSFAPFHQDISLRLPRDGGSGGDENAQIAELLQAKARFISGSDRFVLYHLTILDAVAHRFGVAHFDYARVTRLIDDTIRDVDSAIAPGDTLIIMGDHGHTDSGRHGSGLDVPTVFVARGPAFPAGLQQTIVPVRAVRFFLGHALHLPMPLSYDGPRPLGHARNSAVDDAQKAFFARKFSEVDGSRFWRHFVVAVGTGVFFALFWGLRKIFVPVSNDFPRDKRRFWTSIVVPIGLAILAFGLGVWMSRDTGFRQIPPDYVLNQVWAGLLGFGVLGIWFEKWTAATFGLWVFGLLFLTMYPGVSSLGAPAVFAPSWMLLGILLAFQILRRVPSHQKIPRYRRQTIVWTVLVVLMVQPFFHVESRDAVVGQLWPLIQEIVPISLYPRSILSGVLMWLLVSRERQGVPNKLLSTVMTLYIIVLQIRIIPENHLGILVFGIVMLGLAYASWRRPRLGRMELESQGGSRAFFLCALLVLTFYLLRIGHESRTDLLLVFAATRFSMLLAVRAARSVRDLQIAAILILFLGIVGVGWMTLGWALARVEWGVLYDFVSPDLVVQRMGHFYPLILLRYVIPVMVVRLLVTEVLMGKTTLPRKLMAYLVGLKYVASIAIFLGVAVTTSASPVSVGVVSHIAVFLLLSVGLL